MKLSWNGQTWRLLNARDGQVLAEGHVFKVLDVQSALLLRWTSQSRTTVSARRWLWLAAPKQLHLWQDLRRAVYALDREEESV